MWYLTSENDSRIIYIVSPKQDVVIGRSIDAQNCNFAITNDTSISRKHATLAVSDSKELYLQDSGSKYGTFINESTDKIPNNSKILLRKHDIIKFGKLNSIWKVNEIFFITCTSTLKGENLQKLKVVINEVGGMLKSDWDDECNYLTMPAITLTIKVVLALTQGSHIVTTKFWDECLDAVKNNKSLPNPKNFIPQIIESTLNKEEVSFLPNENRKSLFMGKKFVFFSRRQLDMYKGVLNKSSGTALLLSESSMTKSMLCGDNVVVIQYNIISNSQDTQAHKNNIADIVNYLKNKGKRVVADAEIGLAILYCSCLKYCNPNFNFTSEVIKQSSGEQIKKTNILAPESQEISRFLCKKENIVIDESLTMKPEVTVSSSSRRKLSESNDETNNPTKKLATESNQVGGEGSKRKLSEDYDDPQINPSKRIATKNNDNHESDNLFNFTNAAPSHTESRDSEKKLNFAKPQKRKIESVQNDNEDDLFNFIQDKNSKQNVSKMRRVNDEAQDSIETVDFQHQKKTHIENKVDIEVLRGSKLKELMESNLHSNVETNEITKAIKIEVPNELDIKMNDMNLGTTVIRVKNDLIIKKEPIKIEAQNTPVINFKKFKKVWPIKMQVTLISSSSMNVIKPSLLNETDTPLQV